MLYAQWRFRGICPWEAHNRRPKVGPDGVSRVAWPSRLEALMSAFAWYAADRERDVMDAVEAFSQARKAAS